MNDARWGCAVKDYEVGVVILAVTTGESVAQCGTDLQIDSYSTMILLYYYSIHTII